MKESLERLVQLYEATSQSEKAAVWSKKLAEFDKAEIEKLAQDRFGKGVKQLNKLEASGLIDELLAAHGNANGNNRRRYGNGRYANAGGRR